MEIKVRESKHQPVGKYGKIRLKAKLIGYDVIKHTSVSWSFNSNTDVTLLHSGDAEEGRFLHYNDQYTPTIDIEVSDDLTHEIRILAEVENRITKDIIEKSLSANNTIIETTVSVDLTNYDLVRSNPIKIRRNIIDEDWV